LSFVVVRCKFEALSAGAEPQTIGIKPEAKSKPPIGLFDASISPPCFAEVFFPEMTRASAGAVCGVICGVTYSVLIQPTQAETILSNKSFSF
tara:strand:+ start:8520 stop:8795 length:276 start_codon:yes stop_codon:yes gene_type:complete